MKKALRIAFSVLSTQSSVLLAAAAARACPMCTSGVNDLTQRYSTSAVLLSFLPIAVMGVLGTLIYRSVRRR